MRERSNEFIERALIVFCRCKEGYEAVLILIRVFALLFEANCLTLMYENDQKFQFVSHSLISD